MQYQYRVYHSYEAASKNIECLIYSFDKDREEHEYSCFPMTLASMFSEPRIEASCIILENGAGVLVTLQSELSEFDTKDALASVLIKQNQYIKGLCLIGETYK